MSRVGLAPTYGPAALATALLLGATFLALPASGQVAPPAGPQSGLNRTGDFRDQQRDAAQPHGDIRTDAPAAAGAVRDGAVSAYEATKRGAVSAYEGARDLVTGDEETSRTDGRSSAARREAAAACSRSDLESMALRDLQRDLNTVWGSHGPGPGSIDGICGPRTVRSVAAFQAAHGLDSTGVPSREVLERVQQVARGPEAAPLASPSVIPPGATTDTRPRTAVPSAQPPATPRPTQQ